MLAFPLAGFLACALGWRGLPGRSAGWLASAAVGLSFVCSVGALASLLGRSGEERSVVSNAFDYARTGGVDVKLGILVDPLPSS